MGEHSFELECLVDLDETVDTMFEELERLGSQQLLEELCPYFGVVWPAAQALASWMTEQDRADFRGKRLLELGCGLALPSFIAATYGARVTAADLHPDVPRFLERNLRNNPGIQIAFEPWDWRRAAVIPNQWDWIVASDVLYERDYPEALVGFLCGYLAVGGRAVISDPQRPYTSRFEELLFDSPLKAYKVARSVPGAKQTCVLYLVEKI